MYFPDSLSELESLWRSHPMVARLIFYRLCDKPYETRTDLIQAPSPGDARLA